jgi:hypothetical protein
MSDTPQTDDSLFDDETISALLATPVEQVLANHVFHLMELAAVHLSATPPNLRQAQVVIDAVTGLLEKVGERIGEHHQLFAASLSQMQLAYVRAATAHAQDSAN